MSGLLPYLRSFLIIPLIFTWSISSAESAGTITVRAVGDIMMGTTFPKELLPPEDGARLFDGVRTYMQDADVLFGNLEGPVMDGGEPRKCKTGSETCYEFRTPVRYAKYLGENGFNVLNIANNHAMDFGREGLESTLSALRSERIQATGGELVAYIGVNGKKIAVAGFSYVDTNPYSYSILYISKASAIVRDLKKCNDIVFVSFHGGAEGRDATHVIGEEEQYLDERRGNVMRFAHAVIDAGADLVLGHGPHVLRALELYKGKLIAYSLGNFLTYERFNVSGPNGISTILDVSIDADTGDLLGGTLVPLRLGKSGIPRVDNQNKAIDVIRGLISEDIKKPLLRITDEGKIIRLDQD